MIRLERYEQPPVQVKDEKLMFRLIRASFNQRRKTLVNGLKNSPELHFSKEEIEQALVNCGLITDCKRRGSYTGAVCAAGKCI